MLDDDTQKAEKPRSDGAIGWDKALASLEEAGVARAGFDASGSGGSSQNYGGK